MKLLPKTPFMWLILLVAGYAYYTEYGSNKDASNQAPLKEISAEEIAKRQETGIQPRTDQPEDKGISDKILDKVKENETGQAILSALVKKSVEDKYGKGDIQVIAARETGNLAIIDILKGTGATLNCGAKAVINYEGYLESGIKFDSTTIKDKSTPITINTGSGQALKGLEAGIIGMVEGGKRKISIPAELAFDIPGFKNNLVSKGQVVIYNVDLVSVQDGPYKTGYAINVVEETAGTGRKTLCGDKVKIRYSIRDSENQIIEGGTGDAEFTLGAGNTPIGIEFAAINMGTGGRKIASIPKELLKTTAPNTFPGKLPENSGAVVEMEVVE